jgi:carbon monoxide dehydrogenase subunit G
MKPVALLSFKRLWCCLSLGLSALTGWSAAPPLLESEFEVRSALLRPCDPGGRDDCVKLDVKLHLDAPIEVVWQVITDYQNSAKFISSLKSSSEIILAPNKLQVEQVGRVGWNALNLELKTIYHVQLNPIEKKIQSVAVGGDLKRVSMFTQLHAKAGGGTLLEYTVTTDPARWAPLLVAEELLKRNAHQSFADLKREILRRSAISSVSKPTP